MRLGIVAGIGLIALLAGCGDQGAVEVVTAGASPTTAAVTDCGVSVLGQGERITDQLATCFLEAVTAGEPASLKVSFPTTEGDLITQTYRHLEAGRVQVITDATQDRFGSGKVETQICTGPVRSSFAFTFRACAEPGE